MVGRPINEARSAAIELGLRFYEGEVHKACGHNMRYATNGACVYCARVVSTEQREARNYLRHLAKSKPPEPEPEPEINDPDPVDSEPEEGLEADDDPDARTEEGLQDIL